MPIVNNRGDSLYCVRRHTSIMSKLFYLVIAVFALTTAERYAMVFGTADGWSNYSITSVRVHDRFSLLGALSRV